MQNKIRRYLFFSLLICLMFLSASCGKTPAGRGCPATGYVDASQEPIQENTASIQPFVVKATKASFMISPKAKYHIAAMIVGIKEYSEDWNSQIAPMDLALAWGGLAKDDYEQYIKYEQKGRWYYYRYNNKSPFDGKYIVSHSANTHIIPATENVRNSLALLKVKQLVELEGYLVNVDAAYDGKVFWWHTSLSREDSGDGACEVMYVKKIIVNGMAYD